MSKKDKSAKAGFATGRALGLANAARDAAEAELANLKTQMAAAQVAPATPAPAPAAPPSLRAQLRALRGRDPIAAALFVVENEHALLSEVDAAREAG